MADYDSPVDEYRSAMFNTFEDFQRSYLFTVHLRFPSILSVNNNFLYLAKSTTLPDITVEEASSFYMGIQMKHSTVRRYPDWMLTIYIDRKADVFEALYKWNQLSVTSNQDEFKYGSPKDYMAWSDGYQTVSMLDSTTKSPVLQYKLYKAWPKIIGNIALDYESNQFLTADITFSYQYFEVSKINIITE